MLAQVAVAAAVYAIDKPYSYRVPPNLKVLPGMRVSAPFGAGNRRTEGVVLEVSEGETDGLKDIEAVLDETPVLSASFLRLAAFLRERYFCTYFDAAKAMLPAGLWFGATEELSLGKKPAAALPEKEALAGSILTIIAERGGRISYPELKQLFPAEENLAKTLQSLCKRQFLAADVTFSKKLRDKSEQIATLAVSQEEAQAYLQSKGRRAPQQAAVLELLTQLGSASTKELCYFTGADMASIRRLFKAGMVTLSVRPVFETPLPDYVEPAPMPVLNDAQEKAYEGLCAMASQEKPGAALLYGVTGSGKTAVYLHLIARALASGKTALYLVPEIALTPQLIERLMRHFGRDVAVLHSSLRVRERYDEWRRIREGKARVVIGTRSAVFAPLESPGVIIVDEEQEHSYKSEQTPRYHAREVALWLGLHHRALVVLGSATPSVESMYQADRGVYGLFRLADRYNGSDLPRVDVVDLKEELRRGNDTAISKPLQDALAEAMAAGHQSILFLNRRGAGQYVVCVDCGDVPQCPRCSVSLTYHAANHRLLCHYCGYSQPARAQCPVCGGHRKVMGTGTQKVELELQALFPGTEILRMDADTVSAANSHEDILRRFREEKIPILVGTQMVTKGLDFPNVTLVGVVDADLSLYVNSFRAAETTFSLITQVVGRAGRGAYQGRAIIQTMTPRHAVLTLAAQQDYDRFYALEIELRRLHGLPPFRDLYTLTFVSQLESRALSGAARFRDLLAVQPERPEILGPSPAPVVKVNNAYRYRLEILGSGKQLRQRLAACLKVFLRNKENRGVTAYLDINSYE